MDPKPPAREVSFLVPIPTADGLSQPLLIAFAQASAEAQLLEHAIKTGLSKDVTAFAEAQDQISFIQALETVTLGQAKDIIIGQSSRAMHQAISLCIGFYDVVRMHWHPRPEEQLKDLLKQAVKRRNRIAHQLLADMVCSSTSELEELRYLTESCELFSQLRQLITVADFSSSKFGSFASDGTVLPRFKQTL